MGKPSKLEQLLGLTAALLMVWQTLPDQQRHQIKLRTLHLIEQVAGRLARNEGRAGMGDELAGHPEYAARRYAAAAFVATLRDRVVRQIEVMRP